MNARTMNDKQSTVSWTDTCKTYERQTLSFSERYNLLTNELHARLTARQRPDRQTDSGTEWTLLLHLETLVAAAAQDGETYRRTNTS